jgi:GNAT superfamily N-acetyltransferase
MALSIVTQIVSVVNTAFEDLRVRRSDLRMRYGPKLQHDEDFVSAIHANDSERASFTVIIADDEGQVRATASCVERGDHDGNGRSTAVALAQSSSSPSPSPWACDVPRETDVQDWELKMVAVHPSWQKRGVASLLLAAVEKEIMARAVRLGQQDHAAAASCGQSPSLPPKRGSRLVLSTIKEVGGPVFARHGFIEHHFFKRGEGCRFHIAYMSKELVR